MHTIFVVDSDDLARTRLRRHLEADGMRVCEYETVSAMMPRLKEGAELIVMGARLGDMQAPEAVRTLAESNPALPTIVIADSAEEAVAALRAGARYSARAPASPDEVSLLARRALEEPRSSRPLGVTDVAHADDPVGALLVGETPAISAIRDTIRRVADSPSTTVLVVGESGTGKDTVARAVHAATRREGPFVYLTPSALQEPLLEVELFGIEPTAARDGTARAGLLEHASAGTLFLDEVYDMPVALQGKLLRFLQEKTFRRIGSVAERTSDTRIVASTSRDIGVSPTDSALRPDLVHRLSVVVIDLPPLRHRRADIPLLVRHFLEVVSRRIGRPLRDVSPAALRLLSAHSWPGNVRELANVLERAALLGRSDVIEASDLTILPAKATGVGYRLPAGGIDFRKLEREVVVQALHLARGNQTRAASLLGMTRDQIRYRMVKFNMSTRETGAVDAPPPSEPAVSASEPVTEDRELSSATEHPPHSGATRPFGAPYEHADHVAES